MRLERELKCNFRLEDKVTPSSEEIDNESASAETSGVEECGYFKKEDYGEDDDKFNVAIKMLGSMTMQGYTELRNEIREQFKIPKKWLPSFAKLTENRPKIVGFEIEPSMDTLINNPPRIGFSKDATKTEVVQGLTDVGLYVESDDINDTSWTADTLVPKIENLPLSSFAGTDLSLQDVRSQLKVARAGEKVQIGKIDGSYSDYVQLLLDGYSQKYGNEEETCDFILIDSYDGAQHHNTCKKETNIVSFSTKLLSKTTLESGYGGGTSLDILTWQQMRGDEAAPTIYPAIESVLMDKYKMRKKLEAKSGRRKYSTYDLHDGKMIYLLTGHSLYNRKYHPFVLCSCQRGQGLEEGHVCKRISQEETLKLWNDSKKRWDRKLSKLKEGETYTRTDHMIFVDKYLKGISHFGIHPDYLPRDKIRFDIFHLRCAITRRVLSQLRKFIMLSSQEIIDKFTTLLQSFWSEHCVLIMIMMKPLSNLQGRECLNFIKNTDKIIKFMEDTFERTETMINLCKVMELWSDITPFLVITKIKNAEVYEDDMNTFDDLVKNFYKFGANTILTRNQAHPGDDETFYLHVLRFYIPHIARETWKDHGLGVGIYSMQGFERRNKESKNTLRRFSNNKGNILLNNLRRLFDVFFYEKTGV